MGLRGSEEYSEFSKALYGDEKVLTNDADMFYSFTVGDSDLRMLPIAVLLWRYLGSYHAGLPTAHDVVTGFWQPTEAEALAGLKGPHDFCTLVSLVAAQYSLREAAF